MNIEDDIIRLSIPAPNTTKRIHFTEGKHIKSPSFRLKGKGLTISCEEKTLSGIKLILTEIIKTRVSMSIKDLITSNTIILK